MEEMEMENKEKGVSLSQIFAVVFGRKITFFSVFGGVFLVTFLVLMFGINPMRNTYKSEFDLVGPISETEKYSDGEAVDINELITIENMYSIGENIGLSKFIVDKIYYSNKFNVKYIVDEKGGNQENPILDTYYEISFPANVIKNDSKTRAFFKGIINLINEKEKSIVTKQSNNIYLNLYNDANTYEQKVKYLENQVELLDTRYSSLISTYGDVFVSNNKKLSELKIELDEYFINNSLEDLSDLIISKGYVKGYSNEKIVYQAEIDALTKEKSTNELKLGDLIGQRDDMISNAGTLETVEINEYNSKIIELTLRIRDIDVEISNKQKKIENIEKMSTDPDLIEEIKVLENNLKVYKERLDSFTLDYSTAALDVVDNNTLTYCKNTSVYNSSNELGLVIILALSLILGLVAGVIVNLCIDGKKITSQYKLVHISELDNKENDNINKE